MKYLAFLPFVLISIISKAQNLELYSKKYFISGGDTLPYRVLLPQDFDASRKYPVLVFLHGSGERGSDNQAQLTHGGRLFLKDDIRKNFPAIVVFPQCPSNSFWSNVEIKDPIGMRTFHFVKNGKPTEAMKMLMGLVDELSEGASVDKTRFYVGGLSMGGMGTFELLRRKPKVFAAAFAVCGGDHMANVKKYKHIPLWVFHGAKDDVVPPENSEKVVAKLKSLGGDVKFTLYPEADHNSWDKAFAEPELLPWLFSHKR